MTNEYREVLVRAGWVVVWFILIVCVVVLTYLTWKIINELYQDDLKKEGKKNDNGKRKS